MKICSFEKDRYYEVITDDGALLSSFDTFDKAQDYLDCYYADQESEEFFIKKGDLDFGWILPTILFK